MDEHLGYENTLQAETVPAIAEMAITKTLQTEFGKRN